MNRNTYYRDHYKTSWKRRFSVFLSAAKRRKPVTITKDDALAQLEAQEYKDYYTGMPLDPYAHREALCTPSLDRLDSSKGYESGNVVVTIWAVNRAKCDMSYDDFIALCRQIVKTHDETRAIDVEPKIAQAIAVPNQ